MNLQGCKARRPKRRPLPDYGLHSDNYLVSSDGHKVKPSSGIEGNCTLIFCVQSRCLPIGPRPRCFLFYLLQFRWRKIDWTPIIVFRFRFFCKFLFHKRRPRGSNPHRFYPAQLSRLVRQTNIRLAFKYPAEESNPVCKVRSFACYPSHSQDITIIPPLKRKSTINHRRFSSPGRSHIPNH